MSAEPARRANPVARLGYAAAQSLRVAWYAGHYAIGRRLSGPIEPPGEPPYAARHPAPDRARLRKAFLAVFARDLADIEAGLYPPPRDADPRALPSALAASAAYFADLPALERRRAARAGTEVRERRPSNRYPAYYMQNFHYQTDGWLSRRSARLYDAQVEILFTGAADAMRRRALAAVARHLRGRDQRALSILDVGCGAGRFLAQTLDAFPRLQAMGVDLSEAYLAQAREALAAWPRVRLEAANAEALPCSEAAFDLVVSIYLFHELPPRVRAQVAAEMARVTKPGGLVVFADSIQTGDDPNLDRLLEYFPRAFHEPFYSSYCEEDLDALFAASGLRLESEETAFLTKVRSYRKPT